MSSMSFDLTDEVSEFTENTREMQDNETVISRNTMDTSSEPARLATKKIKSKTPGSKTKSHVHLYFKVTNEGHQCQVKDSNGKICGHIINEGNTTSNRSRHLVNNHNILSPSEIEKVNIVNLLFNILIFKI